MAAVVERPVARRACVITLGGRPFAVDVTAAREVVVLDATTSVPGAPAALVGVMNLRGTVLPIVEVRPLLGLPVCATVGRPHALLLADADRRAAILIERVLGLATVDQVHPYTEDVAWNAITVGELVDEAGERAIMLDAGALLSAVSRTWSSLEPAGPAAPAPAPGA